MKPFEQFTSNVIPLDRANIDTDVIMPKQFLKSISKQGYGENLFYPWRYLDNGEKNVEFVLNEPKCKDSHILLVRENFGCGSSREHAVWGILQYGIKVVISASFADIFLSNAVNNGLLCIVLEEDEIASLFESTRELTIDLEEQKVIVNNSISMNFTINKNHKERLLKGLDNINLTLQKKEMIKNFEQERLKSRPWVFINHS